MVELKSLLARFELILLDEEAKKEAIVTALKKVTGIDISKQSIEIRGGDVHLRVKPLYKSEIFLKKEEIMHELALALGQRSPKNIG